MTGTSGTYAWGLDNSQIVAEAFGRCSIGPTELTREHFISATRSLNLAFQSFSNRGVNLWQVELISIPLIQGVATYTLPSNVVNVLDAYLETYQLGNTVNQNPNFTTTLSSTTVTVVQTNHGLLTGFWINVAVPVAIGGIVLYSFYPVTVIDQNTYTIQSATPATSAVSNGGTVPQFTATVTSSTMTCTLTNHGLVPNQTFIVQVQTTVGGVPLFGEYTVATTPTANTFTFIAQYVASSNGSAYENSGQVQLLTQSATSEPFDRIMTSISRTDYAGQPIKEQQGPPTTFWFDRLSPIPQVTLWEVPDQNGPYALFMYCMRRIQDAAVTGGQTPDIPYRFLDTICADMAKRLARKYASALVEALTLEAKESWAEAAQEDRERVQTWIVPDCSSYFR